MKIASDSHLDHGLTDAHKAWLLATFGDRTSFFIETVLMPDDLAPLSCGLHGPLMGDPPVLGDEVEYVVRGGRSGPSRVCHRASRPTRFVTVIGGPHQDEPCIILYAAFGGPSAPREPFDVTLSGVERSRSIAFWADHALSISSEDKSNG